ncbi:hypothetical protein KIN20_026364 [Parelaphostrongylus tenuis]|uniref:ATP-dependent (S)-NAD(P)H-hydrate dehydratase n=1 Tax=Parelaphostrongylus tenuis TaxID=148309 RepID=A0AAD5QXY3_PARTN|nr:hypothetical protein KIN20_026364 [Parelaphostrongylus tenuis]
MEHVRRLLPALSNSLRKGSCGKLGVIGGSVEYTGAPFFAAISALKLGADLVHVMCAPDAASVIKTYSPELIVYPGLDPERVLPLLERMDAVVLGPGLGRCSQLSRLIDAVLDFVGKKNVPLVIDADGLWFLCESLRNDDMPALQSAILTPNMVEFSRLCESALGVHDVLNIKDQNQLQDLAARLSSHLNTSLFVKGKVDIITSPDGNVVIGDEEGCPRRCGGQGDVTSGTLAMFLLWASRNLSGSEAKLAAGLASSQLVRRCAKLAFSSIGRSMITTDLISNIPVVLQEIDKGK